MLIDAHLHLRDIREEGTRAEILSRAWDFDIHRFLSNSVQASDWTDMEKIASVDQRVVPSFGIHPWAADKAGKGWELELEKFLKHRNAGLGEIGLDRARANGGLEKQLEVFRGQMEIAARLGKPVTIHCVKAWGELLKVLREDFAKQVKFMIHSYHASSELLHELLGLGAYISFSWKWLREGTPGTIGLVKEVPEDRLLLETDFPYTEPGKPGENLSAGKYFECLLETYRIAALARGIDEKALEGIVWNNGTAFLSGTSAG